MSDLVFVASGGAAEGLGHLYRCLSIARAARETGHPVRFHLRADADGLAALAREAAGLRVEPWDEDASPALGARALIVDTRHEVRGVLAAAARTGCPTIVLDRTDVAGLATRTVLPVMHAGPVDVPRLLAGAPWVILAPETRTLRPAGARAGLLVVMGGADPARLTERLAALLPSLAAADRVTLVAGPALPEGRAAMLDLGALRVLRRPSRAALLAEAAAAEAVLAGFGTTVYDVAALGTPVAYFTHRPEDEAPAARLEAAGVGAVAGHAHAFVPERVAARLRATVLDAPWRAIAGPRGQELLAGADGARRIVQLAAELARAA